MAARRFAISIPNDVMTHVEQAATARAFRKVAVRAGTEW